MHAWSCACAVPCRSPQDNETKMFYEIVIAPGYTPDGLEVLKGGLLAPAQGGRVGGALEGGRLAVEGGAMRLVAADPRRHLRDVL